MKPPSKWIVLTSAYGLFEKVFLVKDDIEQVSTRVVDGASTTCVTAKVRGKSKIIHVLETAKEIWWRL